MKYSDRKIEDEMILEPLTPHRCQEMRMVQIRFLYDQRESILAQLVILDVLKRSQRNCAHHELPSISADGF